MQPPRSLWWSSLQSPVVPRDPVKGDLDVDIAIIGGGFTGLWTARELKRRSPDLRIAVIEKSVCGFGASGRNGGWASGLFPVSDHAIIDRFGRDVFDHQRHVLQSAVSNLGAALAQDGINADFVHGGTLTFARSEIQAARLHASIKEARENGVGAQDLEWLEGAGLRERAVVAGALGATYSPHCARVNPARLVRGLSEVVERLGVTIFEETTVSKIVPRRSGRRPCAITMSGTVYADIVVRATEGFTPTISGHRRDVAPIYSLMIATEPQTNGFWDHYGFDDYPTFADDRHLIIYGQRTSDDRIAFGGRGSPYHFGSTVEPRFDLDPKVFLSLSKTLREFFPDLEGGHSYEWGGPIAMPRSMWPSVTYDAQSGLASAGGYTGDGVVLSHVAATALADVITAPDSDTEFTRLPFVQLGSSPWEFEPFRWMGINFGLGLATWADHLERTKGRVSRASGLLDRLLG